MHTSKVTDLPIHCSLLFTLKHKLRLKLNYFCLSDMPEGSTTPEECPPCPENPTTPTPCGDVTGIYINYSFTTGHCQLHMDCLPTHSMKLPYLKF